jgi:lysozyme family protein
MRENFARSLQHVLAFEGGYVNHPADPGGETNFGITKAVYDAWRTQKGQAIRSVKDITKAEVEQIYRHQYWQPIHGDELPAGIDFAVFDGAVNSGVKQSGKWLQRALGFAAGSVDGSIGTVTLNAVTEFADFDDLVDRICDRRLAFLRALKTWPTFGKGWSRRVESVRDAGKDMAEGKAPQKPAIAQLAGMNQSAKVEDATSAPSKGLSDAATGGGIGAGGIAAALQTAQETLTPFSAAGGWIEKLVIGLIILSVLLTVGGIAYRFIASRRKAQLADDLDLQPVSK